MPHRALQEEERSLWTLFGTFFKIGLFTFGGGYAMIALLENEFITKKHWLGRDDCRVHPGAGGHQQCHLSGL